MIYKRGKTYWYRFMWRGELIRESTRQGNPRVARQMEAAHRAALAKGEVGIRERRPVPTLAEFAERDFLPHVRSTFNAKVKTRLYYQNGVKKLTESPELANAPLDSITTEQISAYVTRRQQRDGKGAQKLQISSLNRELQVLRRMFHLAQEWGKVEKAMPKVRMLPGERHRERVLSAAEEELYLAASPPLLREVAVLLLDCGLRPEECFRLRKENVRDAMIELQCGKTDAARRRIPLTPRATAILEMRCSDPTGDWMFPAPTRSGHIEASSLKKQHLRACKGNTTDEDGHQKTTWNVQPFPLYTLRHTCLTRWAAHMDPWTLAYLAGHRDMATTKRYVHPQIETVREAMERAREAVDRARGGHKIGHSGVRSTLQKLEAGGAIQ